VGVTEKLECFKEDDVKVESFPHMRQSHRALVGLIGMELRMIALVGVTFLMPDGFMWSVMQ